MPGSPNSTNSRLGRVAIVLLYATFMAIAATSRTQGLAPASLGLDDLWVALLVKHLTPTGLFTYQAPVPMGFIAASKPFQVLIDHPELGLQILPFLCGLALIPLSGWLATRLTNRWEIGILAAVLVALHPFSGLYPVLVKQFTWDAALTLTVLGVGLPQLDPTRPGRPWLLAGVAGAALVASFNAIFAGAIALHLLALQAFLAHDARPGATRRAILAVLAYDAFAAFLYFTRLQDQSKDWLILFWERHGGFPPTPGLNLHYLWRALGRAYGRWLPDGGWQALTPLPAFGVLWLLIQKRRRWQGLALATMAITLPLAGVLRIYPFGGVRTDYYLQPLLAVTAAIAIGGLAAGVRRLLSSSASSLARTLGVLIPLTAAVLALTFLPFPKTHYGSGFGTSTNRNLVRALDRVARKSDLVLLNPLSRSNIAYYSSRPLELRFDDPEANIFSFRLTDPPSRELTDIMELRKALAKRHLPRRVAVIAMMTTGWYVEWIERLFENHGYRIKFAEQNTKGTSVVRFFVKGPAPGRLERRRRGSSSP